MSFQTYSADGINWSISKLFMYEACPLRFKLKYLDRLPELPQPPDSPLERGNRIHKHLERFVLGETDSLSGIEAKKIEPFYDALSHLRELKACDKATAEEDWFFNEQWDDCARKDVWLWSKLDFSVTDEEQAHAIVGDYKSGKSQYKAVDHIQQTQIYVAVSAIKFPWADKHTAEIWYVDEGWVRKTEYTREEALKFIGRFDARAQRIYNDRFFRPNPNKVTCRWCPYRKNGGTGACPVAAA